ncbi:hypothetical protein GCM10011339_20080 [Echinicola rosea]|uniref:Oligosaccharide repeat unit polymerase n=2 Tax=Echinicola rosea TaxID=1807691 RepID=A0ABQ1UZN5_9BACT|nr:hypothetical protein GCM10011339_20080 [Echinicola rosea]
MDEVDLNGFVGYLSYTYIDIFTANYFNANNNWEFSTLLTIPKNLDLTKPNYTRPPIDEGVYIYNLARYGHYYKPPTPRNVMHVVGLPIENFGFGYANGLTLGLVIASLLLGIVYKISYNISYSNFFNPIVLFFYLHMLFNFNFSSLRINNFVYMLINFLVAIAIYFMILKVRKEKFYYG